MTTPQQKYTAIDSNTDRPRSLYSYTDPNALYTDLDLTYGESQYNFVAPNAFTTDRDDPWQSGAGGVAPNPLDFLITVDTTNTEAGSTNADQFKLTLVSGGTYDCTIDWGDTNTEPLTTDTSPTHTYTTGGVYQIRVSGTSFAGLNVNNLAANDRLKITSIDQHGNWGWTSIANGFYGCANNVLGGAVTDDLSSLTDCSSAWRSSAMTSWTVALPNVTNCTAAWMDNNLTGVWTVELPNLTKCPNAWRDNDLTSWTIDLPNVADCQNAWRGNGTLTNFNQIDLNNCTKFIDAWRDCGLSESAVDNTMATCIANGGTGLITSIAGGTSAPPLQSDLDILVTARSWTVAYNGTPRVATLALTVNTDIAGSSGIGFFDLRLVSGETYNCTISGSFSGSPITQTTDVGPVLNWGGASGNQQMTIVGTLPGLDISSVADIDKLVSVDTCNDIPWVTLNRLFSGAVNLVSLPAAFTDTSGVAQWGVAFSTTGLTTLPPLDSSSATDMNNMLKGFVGATLPPLDTSNVTIVDRMVQGVAATTLPLYDFSSVTTMASFALGSGLVNVPQLNLNACVDFRDSFKNCNLSVISVDNYMASCIAGGKTNEATSIGGGASAPPLQSDLDILVTARSWTVAYNGTPR